VYVQCLYMCSDVMNVYLFGRNVYQGHVSVVAYPTCHLPSGVMKLFEKLCTVASCTMLLRY